MVISMLYVEEQRSEKEEEEEGIGPQVFSFIAFMFSRFFLFFFFWGNAVRALFAPPRLSEN